MPCIEYLLYARPCLILILSLLREHDHPILQMRRLTCLLSHKVVISKAQTRTRVLLPHMHTFQPHYFALGTHFAHSR